MPADSVGEQDLRAEHFEAMVKGFALQEFKMKRLVMVQSSNAWIETYYRETATELTGGLGSGVRGVPRLANFPYGQVTWTKVQAYIEKYGMEGIVSYEDAITNNIDVIAREMLRIARAVAYAVDLQIYTVLEDAAGQSLAITAGYEWDSATVANREPLKNILSAKAKLQIQQFNTDNCILCLSPTDYSNLMGNAAITNTLNMAFAEKILGEIIVSTVVTADKALLVVPKECGTWKAAAPLQVVVTEDKGVKFTIRAWEMGVTQATTPNAICTITNTQA